MYRVGSRNFMVTKLMTFFVIFLLANLGKVLSGNEQFSYVSGMKARYFSSIFFLGVLYYCIVLAPI